MRALNDIYTEYNWPYVPKRVVHKTKPEGFWGSRENAVHFVKYLEAKFNIKTLDDWNYVTLKSVIDNGGGGLLKRYFILMKRLSLCSDTMDL
jgi:hypothetical protein